MTAAAPFASALSQHPEPVEAVGEVIGQILERSGPAPDLAMLFASDHHRDAVHDIAATIRAVLRPATLVGATAAAVLAGATEVEHGPGLALFTGHLAQPVHPVRLTAERRSEGMVVRGITPERVHPGDTLLLLADPFSLPADGLLDQLHDRGIDLPVIGGLASAAKTPGDNRLVLDDQVTVHGGVGALLPAGSLATTVVSQGCEPVGEPMIVTASDGPVILELAGLPALDRLDELVQASGPDDRGQLARGLHLGVALDEHRASFGRGDFLVRNLRSADPGRRALVADTAVPVGTTVQFHVRAGTSADADLWAALEGAAGPGALVFTCMGRGRRFFGTANHDAMALQQVLDHSAVAGMFCAGELGPVGGRNAVHTFSASIAVFRPPSVS